MKAARFYGPKEPLRLEDVPIPELSPNEILVEVRASGICGSDIHILDGKTFTAFTPIILGHEAAGTIAQVGANVRDWKEGDRVCIDCVTTCGLCHNCLRGRDSICLKRRNLGRDLDGAFAKYVKASPRNLIRLPDAVPFDQGAILTDAVATPYHALTKRAKLKVGESIAVFGLGGIGVHALQIAKLMGAGLIIGVDVNNDVLDRSISFGADEVVNSSQMDPVDRIRDLTGGEGVDVALECVGRSSTVLQCSKSVRVGGRAVMIGLGPDAIQVGAISEFVRGEFELIGSSAFEIKEIRQIVDLIAAGRLDLSNSVSKRISLEDINLEIQGLKQKLGNPVRVVITEFM